VNKAQLLTNQNQGFKLAVLLSSSNNGHATVAGGRDVALLIGKPNRVRISPSNPRTLQSGNGALNT